MRTRYGVSPWVHDLPSTRRPDYPRLAGELTADILIVGGGLTGCATALACASAGLRTVVVEAGRVGQGSSGRSAGLLLPEPGPSFRAVVQAHGLRSGRRVFEAWRTAAAEAAALVRRLRLQCALDPVGTLVAVHREHEKAMRREHDARRDAGLDVRWLLPAAMRKATALEDAAGMRLPGGAMLDPYRACLGLASAAARRRVKIFERSPVRKAAFGRDGVQVTLAGGVVQARTAIITTGVATAEFKPLRRHFKAREAYLVLTEPMPAAMRKQLGTRKDVIADSRTPRHLLRFTRDDRILVGGADQDAPPARTRDAVLVQRTGQLMYELLTMYPAISGLQPAYGWDLPYGETADGLMYIGPHRNYPHHLFALGGRGDSITGAFLAARVLARAAAGEPAKGDEVFGWTR